MTEYFPLNVNGIAPYPDFLALAITCIVIGLMIIGVKESVSFNRLFTLLNITVLVVIIVAGATKANLSNWTLQVNVKIN